MSEHLNPLIGVIACGGNSSRMGNDKSAIDYHGIEQKYFLNNLLKSFCTDVFLSCNLSQSASIKAGCNFITDKAEFRGIGPMAGLLSAFSEHSFCSILFIGCDYPFLNGNEISKLIAARHTDHNAVAFKNKADIFEPLLTIYENSCYPKMLKSFYENKYSLRNLLENIHTNSLSPDHFNSLESIDTKEQYHETILKFKNVY